MPPPFMELLDYVESNLGRPNGLRDIFSRMGVTPPAELLSEIGMFGDGAEATFAEARTDVQSLIASSPESPFSKVESDASLLSADQHRSEAGELLADVFRATSYLVDAFAPKDVDHPIKRKVFGAIVSICKVSRPPSILICYIMLTHYR